MLPLRSWHWQWQWPCWGSWQWWVVWLHSAGRPPHSCRKTSFHQAHPVRTTHQRGCGSAAAPPQTPQEMQRIHARSVQQNSRHSGHHLEVRARAGQQKNSDQRTNINYMMPYTMTFTYMLGDTTVSHKEHMHLWSQQVSFWHLGWCQAAPHPSAWLAWWPWGRTG